ncbi:MAG: hypothetical protein OXU81_09820 [Gammaproteobacteria bacterium]|nr:hypothetical protein [Gammaproteobacteria bacterium]
MPNSPCAEPHADTQRDLAELRAAVNESARVARSNMLFLLIVGLYMGILIAETDDLLLLKAGRIDLPLMQVGVPVVTFYMVAPWLFLCLHFNQLVRFGHLTHTVKQFRDRVSSLEKSEQHLQITMVFPFDFVRMVLSLSRPGRWLGFFIVSVLIAVLPVLLLIWLQTRFLAYQSEDITLSHQICITADMCLLFAFVWYVIRELTSEKARRHRRPS